MQLFKASSTRHTPVFVNQKESKEMDCDDELSSTAEKSLIMATDMESVLSGALHAAEKKVGSLVATRNHQPRDINTELGRDVSCLTADKAIGIALVSSGDDSEDTRITNASKASEVSFIKVGRTKQQQESATKGSSETNHEAPIVPSSVPQKVRAWDNLRSNFNVKDLDVHPTTVNKKQKGRRLGIKKMFQRNKKSENNKGAVMLAAIAKGAATARDEPKDKVTSKERSGLIEENETEKAETSPKSLSSSSAKDADTPQHKAEKDVPAEESETEEMKKKDKKEETNNEPTSLKSTASPQRPKDAEKGAVEQTCVQQTCWRKTVIENVEQVDQENKEKAQQQGEETSLVDHPISTTTKDKGGKKKGLKNELKKSPPSAAGKASTATALVATSAAAVAAVSSTNENDSSSASLTKRIQEGDIATGDKGVTAKNVAEGAITSDAAATKKGRFSLKKMIRRKQKKVAGTSEVKTKGVVIDNMDKVLLSEGTSNTLDAGEETSLQDYPLHVDSELVESSLDILKRALPSAAIVNTMDKLCCVADAEGQKTLGEGVVTDYSKPGMQKKSIGDGSTDDHTSATESPDASMALDEQESFEVVYTEAHGAVDVLPPFPSKMVSL